MTTTKHDAALAILRTDFASFADFALPSLMPGYFPNWHIRYLCYELEKVHAGTIRRLIVNLPSRHSKSSLISVAFVSSLLIRDPTCRIMVVSYASDLARQLHDDTRRLIKTPKFRQINPNLKFEKLNEGPAPKDNAVRLETTQGGFRHAATIHGSMTGLGADYIIIDDPNNTLEIESDVMRQNVNTAFDGTILSRLNSQEGRIIVVQQRTHENDLSGHLLAKGGWRQVAISAIATQNTSYPLGHGKRHKRKKGTTIDGRRFNTEHLAKLKQDLGSVRFEAQYQQHPMPPGGNIFKREWLTYKAPPTEPHYVIVSADLATTEGAGDYSVFHVWSVVPPHWFLVHMHRAQLNFVNALAVYRSLDKTFEPDCAVVEKNGIGGAFVELLNKEGHPRVQFHHVTDEKVVRAECITPKFERGEILIDRDFPTKELFENELLGFPSAKNDDIVDALVLPFLIEQKLLSLATRYRRDIRRHHSAAAGGQQESRVIDLRTSGSSLGRPNYWERNRGSPFLRW